jgi:hypothetical protein
MGALPQASARLFNQNLASFTQNISQITAIVQHSLDFTFLINSFNREE